MFVRPTNPVQAEFIHGFGGIPLFNANDVNAERFEPLHQCLPNTAESDETDGPAEKGFSPGFSHSSIPKASFHSPHVSRKSDHHIDAQFGDGVGVS